jgi:hypothetical protein
VREVKMPTINPFAKEQPLYIQVNTKNLKAYLYEYLKSTNTLREIVKLDVKSPDDRIVCENLWRNTFLCVQNLEGRHVSCCSVELTENQHVVKEIAEFLCEKESITGKEFVEIYNRVTGKDVKTEEVADGETVETAETETATETAAKSKIDVLIDEQIIIAGEIPNEENNV